MTEGTELGVEASTPEATVGGEEVGKGPRSDGRDGDAVAVVVAGVADGTPRESRPRIEQVGHMSPNATSISTRST